jgi:hypothetical protein
MTGKKKCHRRNIIASFRKDVGCYAEQRQNERAVSRTAGSSRGVISDKSQS